MLSKEEVEAKFKDAVVSFDGYYKYIFTFIGGEAGYRLEAYFGGSADEIYRESIGTSPVPFLPLDRWAWVNITRDGESVYRT
jgi:hypothetical protein